MPNSKPYKKPHKESKNKLNRSKEKSNKHYTIIGINPIVTLLENDPTRIFSATISDSDKKSSRLEHALALIKQHDININILLSLIHI